MSVAKASKAHIIKGFHLIRAPVKLGFTVKVFLGVKLLAKMGARLVDFELAVSGIPDVRPVEHVLGMYD